MVVGVGLGLVWAVLGAVEWVALVPVVGGWALTGDRITAFVPIDL